MLNLLMGKKTRSSPVCVLVCCRADLTLTSVSDSLTQTCLQVGGDAVSVSLSLSPVLVTVRSSALYTHTGESIPPVVDILVMS